MGYKDVENQRAAQRAYYERNKARVKEVARDRRNYVRRFIQEYKQGKACMDCGIEYPYWILQFDHRPGETKVGNVTDLVYIKSLEAVKEEIEKCDVVCANCHADRTHSRIVKSGADVLGIEFGG